MTGNSFIKYGLAVGAGVALGAAGAILLSRNAGFKKGLSNMLSYGFDLKDKASTLVEVAKENVEDMTAEARHAHEQRKSGGAV